MKTVIWYIRTLFCKHDFTYSEKRFARVHIAGQKPKTDTFNEIKVNATCKKCGFTRKYSKFK